MNKNQAAAGVRAIADAIIEQNERWAKGWDKGTYRDDDTSRNCTMMYGYRRAIDTAFYLSKKHQDNPFMAVTDFASN